MRRLEAIQKFGGGHTNGNEDRNTIHTAIGRKGGSIKHKKDQERKKKGHGATAKGDGKGGGGEGGAKGPPKDDGTHRCGNCDAPDAKSKCKGCGVEYYCNRECQTVGCHR